MPNAPSQQHGSIISNHRVEAAGRQDEAAVGSGRGAIARPPLQEEFSVSADDSLALRAHSTQRMQGGASARPATGTLVRALQSVTQKGVDSVVPPGAGRSLPIGQSSGCRLRRRPALWHRPRPCSPARTGGSACLSVIALCTYRLKPAGIDVQECREGSAGEGGDAAAKPRLRALCSAPASALPTWHRAKYL